jgi:mRNA-degrading endonuclease RelE of RelBE toxin-antitoxin system
LGGTEGAYGERGGGFRVVVTLDNSDKVVFVPSEIRSTDALMKKLAGKKIGQIGVFRAITIK